MDHASSALFMVTGTDCRLSKLTAKVRQEFSMVKFPVSSIANSSNDYSSTTNKYQLLLTNPHETPYYSKYAVNKGGCLV